MHTVAVIERANFGRFNFHNECPDLVLALKLDTYGGAVIEIAGRDIAELLTNAGTQDIKQLEGKHCLVEDGGPGAGIVQFLHLLSPEETTRNGALQALFFTCTYRDQLQIAKGTWNARHEKARNTLLMLELLLKGDLQQTDSKKTLILFNEFRDLWDEVRSFESDFAQGVHALMETGEERNV